MPIYWLDERLVFPPTSLADAHGLLAVGGDLGTERLRLAYTQGIFPWYDEAETPILWHSPWTRYAITQESFRCNRSTRRAIRRHPYEIRFDTDFGRIVQECAEIERPGQDGTWIGVQMSRAYERLFENGLAHCASAYHGTELVGGLYGVTIGSVFFGESMFSRVPDASKIIFGQLAPLLFQLGYTLIDCQVETEHLNRFGAQPFSRNMFENMLASQTRTQLAISWPTDALSARNWNV